MLKEKPMYVHNHWLEQWLDLRYRLGWGQPSDVLRTNRNLLALIGLLALLFLGVGIASFTSKHGRLISPLAIAQTYPGTMLLFTGCTLALAIPVLSWHLTLRRAQVQGITLINGVCFALIQHLPHVVFARMGLSERDARWYALPAEWEKIVKVPDKHYELELRRGNGCAVSLRRLDEAPITFYREPAASQSVSTATTEHGHEEDGTAQTATEKRTMRRAFWRYSLGIDYCSPASVGALVITLIIGGIAFAGLTIFIFSYAMPLLRTPFDFIALVAFTVVFGISGLAMVIGGLRLISTWWQIRHSLITTIEGTVNRWKAFSSSSRPYTIISFTMPDGTNHIFGVAPRFRYRAQQTHTRLAITYRTANEHVMDIQEID